MEYRFHSKVYVGNTKNKIWLRVLLLIVAVVIGVCLLIKLFARDFNVSDLKAVVFALIILGCARIDFGGEPIYVNCMGTVKFDDEEMRIDYKDVISPENGMRFNQITTIKYDDIKEIDLSRELNCYRVVGLARQERLYISYGKEQEDKSVDEENETFIYILSDYEQDDLKKIFIKHANHIVREM